MHLCPVCGYPKLTEPPRSPSGGGSYEICPSCGFQFGVDDDDRGRSYEQARRDWVAAGMPWSSKAVRAPKGWEAKSQLASLKRLAKKKSPGKGTPAPAARKPLRAATSRKKPRGRR